ncbi:MAG: GntP family permease [Methanospirillum sp.]
MDAAGLFAVFVIVLVLVSVASHRYRVPPFFALVGGALLFGLLAGLGVDRTVEEIVAGVGRVFSAFGIIILSGAVIGKVLEASGGIEGIAADVRRYVRDPVAASGLLGYLLAVPLTCCITAFVMLVPVLSALDGEARRRSGLLYLAALGSVVSYALIYPTPVVIPLVEAFDASGSLLLYDALAIPLSLLLALLLILVARRRLGPLPQATEEPGTRPRLHLQAWAPFAVILAAAAAGLIGGISHVSLINLVMLAGAAAALALASAEHRQPAVLAGARHAGVIVFDLVGAGAIGSVIVASGIAEQALAALTGAVPVLIVPFLIAALIQTVQGSRVVTAVIAGRILAGTEIAAAIDPVPLVLMVGAGACIISYVTDPYFWLVQRATGDPPSTVVREYTLPLAAVGLLILGAALLIQVFL